ncbi:unnamed protein product [Microthlaspi erraticum]|uniref:F-box domain-containing protein n=1 Tax=Microthlaspi erraticum TaxID=1685480 RepID=A0A6D2L0C2_9BRAS|nr:unnamed protein product [Microthlaspi erraticum]
METGDWSNLPPDMLGSIFQRLSLADFHRAKTVCWNWNSSSRLTLSRKRESPWLILFPHDSYDVCMLYNPDEDRVYRTNKDLSGTRFLANYGNWLLILDSTSNLYMIDLFSENRIDLPPLESLISSTSSLKRVGDKEFIWEFSGGSYYNLTTNDLRGRLWVNEKTEEFVVAWYFYCPSSHLCFCKKGELSYTVIPLREEVPES